MRFVEKDMWETVGKKSEEAPHVPVITLYYAASHSHTSPRKPKTRKFAKIFKSFSAAHFRASSMLWGRRTRVAGEFNSAVEN